MELFLLLAFPVFFLLLLWLPWGTRNASETAFLVGTFFKGVLMFFPGYIAILICRRIFGFSYSGFVLFLSLLQRDHLVPLLAAIGALLVLKSKLEISSVEEENFLGVFAFLAGFMTMMNIADMVRTWGNWNASVLFLLPLQRISAVLVVSLAARRFCPWEGRDAAWLLAVGAGLALGFAIPSFLFLISRAWWSLLLTAAPLLASMLWFTMKFPRVVRA